MIYFISDYSLGAHPKILDALAETNFEHANGYGEDAHCDNAKQIVKDLIGRDDCEVHLMVGGTPTNIITIAAALKPWESVIAPRTGHIYFHETGGVEASGHKINPMDCVDGKLTPALIDKAFEEYEDEHTTVPKLAYISQTTELGTVYTKAELEALRKSCDEHDMFLYMDGARLGCALTSDGNDLNIKEIANLVDAFYIGGTKNGALFGEAVILLNDAMKDHYRWVVKQNCGMFAKGKLLGVQFETILDGGEDSIYYQNADHANKMAKKLRDGISSLGYEFDGSSTTNQIFPIIPTPIVKELLKDFLFYEWAPAKNGLTVIRLVTSWGTKEEEVDTFLATLKKLK